MTMPASLDSTLVSDALPTETVSAGGRGVVAPAPDSADVVKVETLDDAPLAEEPPAEPAPPATPKGQLAREAAERARRSRIRRQREAEAATRLRRERDELNQRLAWEQQQRLAAEQRARPLEDIRDPAKRLDAMRTIGLDPKTIAEDAVRASTPEGQLEALRAELRQERAVRERQQQQQQAQQEIAYQRQQEQVFVDQAADAENYPTLARIAKGRPQTLISEGNQVCEDVYQRTGRYPSFDQVLAYLEGEYSKTFREEKPNREAGPQQGSRPTTPAKEGQPAASAKTITARASERAILPKSVGEMTREEQISYFADQVRKSATRG